jgi:hypothetical protein
MLNSIKIDLNMATTETVNCVYCSKHSFLYLPAVNADNTMP